MVSFIEKVKGGAAPSSVPESRRVKSAALPSPFLHKEGEERSRLVQSCIEKVKTEAPHRPLLPQIGEVDDGASL